MVGLAPVRCRYFRSQHATWNKLAGTGTNAAVTLWVPDMFLPADLVSHPVPWQLNHVDIPDIPRLLVLFRGKPRTWIGSL